MSDKPLIPHIGSITFRIFVYCRRNKIAENLGELIYPTNFSSFCFCFDNIVGDPVS